MGGKGTLNYLPIVPKASIYVPKVMRKPVMGGNTVSETFTHMFLFRSAQSFKNWPRQPNQSVMAEYGREGYVELKAPHGSQIQRCKSLEEFSCTPKQRSLIHIHTHLMFLFRSVSSFEK